MKKPSTLCTFLFLILPTICAENISCIHENVRETPYPQQEHVLYINPSPLLVPQSMKQADFLQFNLSQSMDFSSANSILSKPAPWCMFNPHRILEKEFGIGVFVLSVKKERKCLGARHIAST